MSESASGGHLLIGTFGHLARMARASGKGGFHAGAPAVRRARETSDFPASGPRKDRSGSTP